MSTRPKAFVRYAVPLILLAAFSCGLLARQDICNCLALLPDVSDYRHAAKHVPIPSGTPQEIDVQTMLAWPADLPLPPDQPRFGRELTLVDIALAYLENASVNQGDCDVHLEISQTADKNAPRVVIETPVDSEYCNARRTVQTQLKRRGFTIDTQHGGELPQPLPVSVLGLPFEDFEHGRGSVQVATVWEIHPAVVTFK